MKTLIFVLFSLVLLFACSKGKSSDSGDSTPAPTTDVQPIIPGCKKCIVMAEQSEGRVIIANTETKKIIWEWKPENSNVNTADVSLFGNPSDVKVVYSGKYILMSASKGGIALIRISDKKTVYYANAIGASNPHSIELLPDGNIVSASSTGNYLALYKVDTLHLPGVIYKKITVTDAHNIVWDKKNQVLWTATGNQLKAFTYNQSCSDPGLTENQTLTIPGSGSHDLFTVYN